MFPNNLPLGTITLASGALFFIHITLKSTEKNTNVQIDTLSVDDFGQYERISLLRRTRVNKVSLVVGDEYGSELHNQRTISYNSTSPHFC